MMHAPFILVLVTTPIFAALAIGVGRMNLGLGKFGFATAQLILGGVFIGMWPLILFMAFAA